MIYLPPELWYIVFEYIKFMDYINLQLTDKNNNEYYKKIDYKNSDFLKYISINKNLLNDIDIIIIILKRIKSISCDNMINILNNIFSKKRIGVVTMTSLVVILKLSRSIILSTSFLGEKIINHSLSYWMTTIYKDVIKKLSNLKVKIKSNGYNRLLDAGIINKKLKF